MSICYSTKKELTMNSQEKDTRDKYLYFFKCSCGIECTRVYAEKNPSKKIACERCFRTVLPDPIVSFKFNFLFLV